MAASSPASWEYYHYLHLIDDKEYHRQGEGKGRELAGLARDRALKESCSSLKKHVSLPKDQYIEEDNSTALKLT